MQARQLAQVRMDIEPGAITTPLPKLVIHRLPGTILAGQIAPRAAGPQDIEDALGDAPHV